MTNGILIHSPTWVERVVFAALEQLKGISLSYGAFGSTSAESLVNRTVLLSAIVFSVANLYLRYRAHPPNSPERQDSLNPFYARSFFLLVFSVCDAHLLKASIALKSFIEFRYILNDSSSHSSLVNRVGQLAYTAFKYVSLTAIAMGVFRACNANFFNGVFFASIAGLSYSGAETLLMRADPAKTTAAEFKTHVGSYIASGLILTASFSGIGASLLSRGVPLCMSGVTAYNLDQFLSGIRYISLVFGVIVPLIKHFHSKYESLDCYSRQFLERFPIALAKARELSGQFQLKLSKNHLRITYDLALWYSIKKTDPAIKQQILMRLREIPDNKKLIHFVENLPFLDLEELQEFAQTCGIQPSDIWSYMNVEQIKTVIFTQKEFDENLLATLERELEAAIRKFDGSEQKELKIYEEIHEDYQKIVEHSSWISSTLYSLKLMNPAAIESPEVRAYVQSLKDLMPQLTNLKKKIEALEGKIEECTGEYTQPAVEAMAGVRVSDCQEILQALNQPHSSPFTDMARLLAERGVKHKYDLIKKKILLEPKNGELVDNGNEALKARLTQFLLNAGQLLPAALALERSWTDLGIKVAEKIYKWVAFPFFIGLRFYVEPRWSAAGLLWGAALVAFSPNNRIFQMNNYLVASIRATLFHLTSSLPRISRMFVYISWQTSVLKFCSTRVGFIPAFMFGAEFPVWLGNNR